MKRKITYLRRDELISEVKKYLLHVNSVLDIGCGIQPQQITETLVHIHIDAHQEYIDVLKDLHMSQLSLKNKFRMLYLNMTTFDIIKRFPKNFVNSIFLLDVIEHLNKEHAIDLLKSCEEIASNQIVIFTPFGFVEQLHPDGKDAWGLSGGKWQEHQSGWTPEDFDDTWEFFVCEKFHEHNNVGIEYKNAKGAFFAVKTISKKINTIKNKNILYKILYVLLFKLRMLRFKI